MMNAEDNQSIASESSDKFILTVMENYQSYEVDNMPTFTSATALPKDFKCIDYDHTEIQLVQPSLIQPVESIIRITEEEQRKREEDPNLTINELLGLSPCEGHVTTPLQMLDGQYMNQPSHFLPLAQEARKLAKKIRQEEETSKWSGIPVEQLLNSSFTEQLNAIQALQQIVPLQAVKEHLPKDIITILKILGKVDNTPFNKLYYLAENCVDRYYTSVIKTFVEIVKCSATNHQIVLVNTARGLKHLGDFGEWQCQLFTVLEKYHLLPNNLDNLQSQSGFLKKATSKNIEHLQQAISVQQNCSATLCTHINNILPHITKLEQTVLELQKCITTDHNRVQLNALDYDLDIDGPQLSRRHVNTAVVLVQDHLTLSDSEILDVTELETENHSTEESSNPIYNHSEVSHGNKILLQQHIEAQPNTTPMQMKSQN